MRHRQHRYSIKVLYSILFLAFFSGGAKAVFAGAFGYYDSDCHALKLKAASGVPQAKVHQYKFVGTCNIIVVYPSGPSVLRTVPAVAEAAWDGNSFQFKEAFHVLETFKYSSGTITAGNVSSIFKCDDDPLISKASCIMSKHANQSGYTPFSNPALKQHRPLLKGKTTLAEATALSKQSGTGNSQVRTPIRSLSQPKK